MTSRQLGYIESLITICAALSIAWFAIDRQSFWIDEFGTWNFAKAGSWSEWWPKVFYAKDSDGELPLYHALVFVWSRLAGLDELSLRSINVIFFLGLVVIVRNCSALLPQERRVWLILLLINCFVWAYLNQARPYALILLGSSILTISLLYAQLTSQADFVRSLSALLIGSTICFGASPTSAPFILGIGVSDLYKWWRNGQFKTLVPALYQRFHVVVVSAVILIGSVSFIGHSLLNGATPDLGHKTSLGSISFGLIEIVGGAGLLPGREQLRVQGPGAVSGFQWLLLLILFASIAVITIYSLVARYRRLALTLMVICLLSVLAVSGLGYRVGFRVVGRHVAFIVPPLMLVFALGLLSIPQRAKFTCASLFGAVLLASSLRFHFGQDYKNEDFRQAVYLATINDQNGGTTWWDAQRVVLEYFHVHPVSGARGSPDQLGSLYVASDEEFPSIETWRRESKYLPPPSMIVVQRPETNDVNGFFASVAKRCGLAKFRDLNGVVIYSTSTASRAPKEGCSA